MTRSRTFVALVVALGVVLGVHAEAEAGSYVVYLHGRSMGSWTKSGSSYTNVVNKSGWTPVFLEFDGSAALNDAPIHGRVKTTISSSCSSGNSCILMCYSTGCLRMLLAVSELRASGNGLAGLVFAMGSGSAAGGTALAELATQGLTGLLAKIVGQQERADFDLARTAALGTWEYIQDDMPPQTLYHVGGNKDTCKSLLGIKLCGSGFIPGVDDGVVGLDSASGMARLAGANPFPGTSDACSVARYPGRAWEYGSSTCGGVVANHAEIPSHGASRAAARHAASASTTLMSWGNTTGPSCDRSLPATSASSCDRAYASGEATQFATATGALASERLVSNTFGTTASNSCYGRCGQSGCDLYAFNTGGSLLPDYDAANCDAYNNARREVYRARNTAGVHRAFYDLGQAQSFAGTSGVVTVPFYTQPTDQGGMVAVYRRSVAGGAERVCAMNCGSVGGTTLGQLGWVAVGPNGAYRTSKYLYELQKSIGGVMTYVYTVDVTERNGLEAQGWTSNGSIGAAWSQ